MIHKISLILFFAIFGISCSPRSPATPASPGSGPPLGTSVPSEGSEPVKVPASLDLAEFFKKYGERVYPGILSQIIREQQQWVVPKELYHSGKREHLIKSVPNISEGEWRNSIMGEGSRYKYGPQAKGFYGSSWLMGNFYADSDDPWFLKIRITDKCRNPKSVASLIDLFKDKRFSTWFKTTNDFPSIEEFKQKCFEAEAYGFQQPDKTQTNCQNMFDSFLKENAIKVVFDDKFPDVPSFYIRDRNCIEKNIGTGEEILALVIQDDIVREAANIPEPNMAGGVFRTVLNIFFEHPDKIKPKFIQSLSVIENRSSKLQDFIDAYQRCEKNGFDRRLIERMPAIDGGTPAKDREDQLKREEFFTKLDRICHNP